MPPSRMALAMNNLPPISEPAGTPAWSNWLQQVAACLPWKRAFNVTATLAFGAVAAQSQSGLTVTVKGARSGDAVQVTPANDTAGIVYAGTVTENDTVTVFAKNFTAGAITPASTAFRLIVHQN
jgi:hypothetical protein